MREPAGLVPGGAQGPWRNWHFGPELNDGRGYVGQGEGTLGPDGQAVISHEASGSGIEGAAYRYRLEASVQDAARQEIAASAAVLVHPAAYYIAARLDAGTQKNAAQSEGGAAAASAAFAAAPSAYFLSAGKPATLG